VDRQRLSAAELCELLEGRSPTADLPGFLNAVAAKTGNEARLRRKLDEAWSDPLAAAQLLRQVELESRALSAEACTRLAQARKPAGPVQRRILEVLGAIGELRALRYAGTLPVPLYVAALFLLDPSRPPLRARHLWKSGLEEREVDPEALRRLPPMLEYAAPIAHAALGDDCERLAAVLE